MSKNKAYTHVSLFSGAGGLDIGLEQAGFHTVWANDFNHDACETHRLWSNTTVVEGDIGKVDYDTIPDCDIASFGFPCQGFSLSGLRKVDDSRNVLYRHCVKLVEKKQPKLFLAENVKGLLTLGGGKIKDAIIADFESKGYAVSINLVNAADYHVPEDRQRILLVGIRKDIAEKYSAEFKLFRPISVRGKMTYILSNNKVNTNYFGRTQGDAIPVTMQDGHKIVEAAKALIGSKNCYFLPVTSQSLYTKCVIVWSDEVTKPEEDEMLRIWFGNESEAEKTDNIMRLAKARRGRVDILQECDKNKVVNVWQLSVPDKGCSASSFTQTTVGEVLANCIKHYEDMEIDRSEACKNADGTRRDFARPDSIILALSAMNKDNSIVPINNQMWMQLNNCVYNGGKYPSQLLSMIYERICKDALKAPAGTMYIIPPTLAGAIKAILIRNYKEDITVSLNPNNMSPAYVTGRIFALLVSGQHAIVPENQSQYDKRFLSRVVTNPVKVMPTIQMNFMQLKNRAQKSNRMGTYNAINNQIMDLIDMLDGNYPGRLTQVQRGEFFIGYNQQMHYNRDAAIAKKREKEENTIAMNTVNTVATVDETTVA